MEITLKQIAINLVLPLISIIAFSFLLGTNYYAYIIYLLLGFIFYLLTKFLGWEISFLFIIPILSISLVLTGDFFLLDFYNNNGLNPLKIHPFLLAWLVVFFLFFIENFLAKRIIFDKIFLFCILVLFIFFGVTFITKGIGGMSLAIHNYLGPISFFLFFYCKQQINMKKVNKAIDVMIGCSVLIGFLGVLEYVTKTNIFQQFYSANNVTWLESTYREGYRIKTIIGHPLDNALFFLFSMIIVQMRVKDNRIKYTLLLLFVIDILLTGSRSIFVISFLVLVYNEQSLKDGLKKIKQYFITLCIIGVTFLVTLSTSLGSTLMSRVGSADDSTEARVMLIDYFIKHLSSFQIMGLGGATENIIIIGRYNTPIFLENPWIILFFDVGYFILIYILLLILILCRIEYKALAIILILALSGYNSFGVKNNANYFLFYLLTYGYILAREKKSSA
ncbi:hypothetical protein [Bacillus wiedmannii]|uniref:hypothetical protein n=1 Tax=Bacillus wiedmannii TaxID=1890302 RepID=UPI000BF372C0|nr:hypothetical protein [Bacillus wiedmannii]PFZ34343.1 hypothetical protein COL77_30205 [Bacillus wiedmannii]PGA83850.1 hypothetical protein COL94_19420 [Bacillus wiedmannii]PGD66159.1 hypothetical protein COM41_02310 [Bacillus wiedmannii]